MSRSRCRPTTPADHAIQRLGQQIEPHDFVTRVIADWIAANCDPSLDGLPVPPCDQALAGWAAEHGLRCFHPRDGIRPLAGDLVVLQTGLAGVVLAQAATSAIFTYAASPRGQAAASVSLWSRARAFIRLCHATA